MTEDDNYKNQTGNGNDGENYNVNNKDNNNSSIYIGSLQVDLRVEQCSIR